MSKDKVIFFDIDGTIIDSKGYIPLSAIQAIQAARSHNAFCVINTGRPYSHIVPAVKEIGFDGFICSCGQHIILNEKLVFHISFSPEFCRKIVILARQCRVDVVYEGEHGIWFDLTHPPLKAITETANQFAQRGFDVSHSVDSPDFCFDKLCAYVHPDSNMECFLETIEKDCSVIYREGGMLEIIKRGCSKEQGLKEVIRLLNIPLENCYAIGDSTNDLPMLACVPHSIAMGNAPEEVKTVVEYVTDSLKKHGLSKALSHFGLVAI